MHRIQDVTTAALLGHVEARLQRRAEAERPIPQRVYAADAEGRVIAIEVPEAADAADQQAINAIVDMHLRELGAVVTVLQVPNASVPGQVILFAGSVDGAQPETRIWAGSGEGADPIRLTRPALVS